MCYTRVWNDGKFIGEVQAASGFNFNPNAFITFKITLKFGFQYLKSKFADAPPPAPDQVRGVLPQLR
jgi:hypothetical protein